MQAKSAFGVLLLLAGLTLAYAFATGKLQSVWKALTGAPSSSATPSDSGTNGANGVSLSAAPPSAQNAAASGAANSGVPLLPAYQAALAQQLQNDLNPLSIPVSSATPSVLSGTSNLYIPTINPISSNAASITSGAASASSIPNNLSFNVNSGAMSLATPLGALSLFDAGSSPLTNSSKPLANIASVIGK